MTKKQQQKKKKKENDISNGGRFDMWHSLIFYAERRPNIFRAILFV